jgi:D-alanyl-D-alanine carboxypeptidase
MKRAAVAGGTIAIILITTYGIVHAGWSLFTSLLNPAQTERSMSADAVPVSAPAATGTLAAAPVLPPVVVAEAATGSIRPGAPPASPTAAVAPAPVLAPNPAAPVCANPNGMGIARVVEIDTTGGPGFGSQHFKTYDFLREHEVVAHDARKRGRHEVQRRVVHGPPYAAIVVDDNTGQAICGVNADEPRHPASLTKIMTLYMLFEQLEAGKFMLDTPLQVSAHAAGQAPVKLGLKANQTIAVEDAIKGIVTKSANDAAAVVGEAIGGGDEAEAARLMTLKARALGMSNTTYINASGLPADDQITTARDQALLGLAIQNRFPNYAPFTS